MHIFQSDLFMRTRDGVQLFPFQRYVMPTGVAREIEAELVPRKATYTLSHFNSYERRYAGQDLAGKKLLIYRHGAIGDTLMATALVAWLRRQHPEATIDLYCRPQNVELWHGVGCRTMPGYPSFDAAQRYDYHLLFENMLEANSEPDQGCAMDDQFSFAGIDPASVPDEAKVPVVVEKPGENWEEPKRYMERTVVVQWNASNANRSYPYMDTLIELLKEHWRVVLVGDRVNATHLDGICDLRGRTDSFRKLIRTVYQARLVICPDSSVGHLAAAFPHVPVISLWGLFHPNDRVRYYRNHHPLFVPEACPHAPCRSHLPSELPAGQCKDALGFDGKVCAALAAITPEMIVQKAKEILCVS